MDEDSQQLPESPRDSQQMPESPPPLQKTAARSSPLPSSRSSLSSFESIVASGTLSQCQNASQRFFCIDYTNAKTHTLCLKCTGFSDITPTPPPVQADAGSESTNAAESATTPNVSAQRSRTPTPSLESKPGSVPGSVPASAIQESNQPSPNATTEPGPLPLVGQTQNANNNSVQNPRSESQGKQIIRTRPHDYSLVGLDLAAPAAPIAMVKTQKKQRKEGTNDFDNTSRDRDDVQSPAYSDISDDSTPVAESEMSGKCL